ncbi:hypothetical protein D1P53_005026 [Cryptococcus gattii VGV]|nr:hypothetical protein D1P53_005026 [Cryptococcus gattii VGV]
MTKTNTPPPPSTLHSYEPPTEAASHPPPQRHHHDHEHHHHHSHHVRSAKSSGTVKETFEEKHLDGFKGEETVEVQAKVVSEPCVPPIIASAKASTKTKSTSIAASIKTPSAAVATSHITRRKSILATTSAGAQVVKVVPAAASAPATIVPSVAPSVATLPTSVKPYSKTPSSKAVSGPRTVKDPSLRALSPTPSRRSRYSHHHPEVIVNVTIPQAVAAPAPLPPPVLTPDSLAPIVTEGTVKEAIEKAVEDVPATPLVVPVTPHHASKTVSIPAVPPSPSPSTRSRLSRLQSAKATTVPLPSVAPTAVEQDVEEEAEETVVEETKVVTTTRTIKRRPASPPKVFESCNRYVENILEDEDPAPPPPTKPKSSVQSNPQIPPRPPSPVCSAPNTPVTMKCHLFNSKSSLSPKIRTVETTTVETISYPLLQQQSIEETDVNTAASTAGGPTTKGIGGARSVVLTASSGRMSGTKAGIRPIPMVDYKGLMKRSPAPSQKKPLPPPTAAATPPAPVPTRIDEATTTSAAQAMPLPATTAAMTASAPSTASPTTIALEATPAPTSLRTIMTLSAQLDRDSHRNEHVHARWRDHTNVNKVNGPDAARQVETTELPVETDKERRRQTKRETKERKKRDKLTSSPPYRPIGALPPPISERYACPPAPTEIERQAKQRLGEKMGRGGPTLPPPLPLPRPQLFPRPPPLVGVRPPIIPHQMFNPMMFNPMMSGYPIGTMGMPMGMGMPMAGPMPGIMPGMPGVGNLPRGWFGRDQLGRGALMGPGM